MADVTIYHNPRCTKSRQTLALLGERGLEPTVVEYLKTPPSPEVIAQLVSLLGGDPAILVRQKEARQLGLTATDDSAEMIAHIAKHPEIMQRPIVVVGDQARIGRPPEAVLEIL